MAAKKRNAKPDLRAYRRKRDFERTPEPRGDVGGVGGVAGDAGARAAGPVFVVQKHAARQLHYDLRLELDDLLKSWALPKGPSLDPATKALAVAVENHPMEYASFEGVIPEGEYGGGTVMLWDSGRWEPIGDPVEGLQRGDLKFRLFGEKLRGDWVLVRMSSDAGEGGRNWLLIKKADAESRKIASFNVQSELPFSVASGRTMEEIAADPVAVWTDGGAQPVEGRRGGMPAADLPDPSKLSGARKATLPETFAPQLARAVARAPEGDDWLHEVKLDGYRLLCRIEDGAVRLLTRNGHDWTDRFGAVARAAARLPVSSAILDGEVTVLNTDGIPDFGALQAAIGGRAASFAYFVFDVPHAGGFDLTAVPLIERKGWLEALFGAAPMAVSTIQYCEHLRGNGPVVFQHAAKMGLEGIVSKRADAPYVSRRSDHWLKVRNMLRQEFIVGGFTDSPAREGFGALLVGYHDRDGRLRYAGRVGSGFDEPAIELLSGEIQRRIRKTAPFRNPGADPDAANARWVRPELVVEVQFAGWTREGLLRQPVYRGLRMDVHPGDVVLEQQIDGPEEAPQPVDEPVQTSGVVRAPPPPPGKAVVVAGVRISHPDRSVYPEDRVSKRQVAQYYEAVADWMLPHVAGRPLSLVRCPLGLAGESFYQRHLGDGFPSSVRGISPDQEIEGEPYLVIDGLEGIVSLAQMGVLEIHTWGCREDDLERPDQLVFDLDPGPGIEWADVVASARFVGDHLEELGLQSFVKTSGGRGLHVVVPLVRRAGWPQAKSFAHGVAKSIVSAAPRNFVATMSKAFRRQRIFVDYLRNTRGSTAIAPYSTRARPGACVATPLSWSELSASKPPSRYTVKSLPKRLGRLKSDPWAEYRTVRQSITARLLKSIGAE